MNRFQAGYIFGVGFLVLGLYFGFIGLGPCGSSGCALIAGGLIDSSDSFLLSWGFIIIGVVILVVSFLMSRRVAD